jgi:complex iron-sulfur molybdoenzyme family reductase subunit gamma
MEARYIANANLETLLDPGARPWAGARADRIDLIGTPAGLQPTAALRNTYAGKQVGAVARVRVAAAHNGEVLAFRLEWGDANEDVALADTTSFPDGAGILFPSAPGAPSVTMGAAGLAVNAWYWRADENGRGRHVVAEGLGTTRTVDVELVRGQGVWKEGLWRVVIARALRVQTPEPVAQLEPGQTTGFAVALWEGSHGERAGVKAFSGDWRELDLAPAPATGA